jgi:hypothetical protein
LLQRRIPLHRRQKPLQLLPRHSPPAYRWRLTSRELSTSHSTIITTASGAMAEEAAIPALGTPWGQDMSSATQAGA